MDDTSSLQLCCMLSQLSDNLVAIHMHNVPYRQISGNREGNSMANPSRFRVAGHRMVEGRFTRFQFFLCQPT